MAASALLLEQNLWEVVFMAAMVLSVGQAKNNFWEVDLWATMVMSGGQTMMTIWEVVYKGYFGEFFGNRNGEMFDNEIRVEHLVDDNTTEWNHVSSEDNAADSVSEDFGLDSEWMTGPAYLKLPVKEWPVNRDFADRKSQLKLPVEEIRKRYRVVAVPVKINSNMLRMVYRVEERDLDLLRGGQAGHYPAPLDEVGDDERVWVQIWGFSYPVVYDQDRERYVYGAADLAVAADVEGGGHVGHGHRVQQGDEGVGQHVKTRGRPAGQGQGQHDEFGDQIEEEVGFPGGLKKVLDIRKTYEDFGKNVYLHHELKLDWKEEDQEKR